MQRNLSMVYARLGNFLWKMHSTDIHSWCYRCWRYRTQHDNNDRFMNIQDASFFRSLSSKIVRFMLHLHSFIFLIASINHKKCIVKKPSLQKEESKEEKDSSNKQKKWTWLNRIKTVFCDASQIDNSFKLKSRKFRLSTNKQQKTWLGHFFVCLIVCLRKND